MTTHINAIRTVALLCIAGKALATSYATVEHGAPVSATIYVCFTNFLLLTLGYFSFEYGIRFFVLPNARQIHAAYSFRKRMTSAAEQAIDKQPPEPEPSSPLDSPKVREIIDYTLGTFANVLTDEELILLESNLKAFIIGKTDLEPAVNRRLSKITTHDIYHCGWNMVKRLPKNNSEMAVFLKSQFPILLSEVETSTIAKKLSSEEGAFTLPKIEPNLPLHPFPLAKKLGMC